MGDLRRVKCESGLDLMGPSIRAGSEVGSCAWIELARSPWVGQKRSVQSVAVHRSCGLMDAENILRFWFGSALRAAPNARTRSPERVALHARTDGGYTQALA